MYKRLIENAIRRAVKCKSVQSLINKKVLQCGPPQHSFRVFSWSFLIFGRQTTNHLVHGHSRFWGHFLKTREIAGTGRKCVIFGCLFSHEIGAIPGALGKKRGRFHRSDGDSTVRTCWGCSRSAAWRNCDLFESYSPFFPRKSTFSEQMF